MFSLFYFPGVFGESVSVMEGDSVTLNTDVTEILEDDDILWKFGAEKSRIAEISREKQIFFTYDNVPDGIFRDRLKLDNQTGSLTIKNITSEHVGLYELQISGRSFVLPVTYSSRLPVTNITRDCSSSSSSSGSSYCSLVCSVVNVGHVTLSWYKGNSLLSSISVSDLSISLSLPLEVEYQDKNTYSCVLNNPISNQITHLDISQLCHTCAGMEVVILMFICWSDLCLFNSIQFKFIFIVLFTIQIVAKQFYRTSFSGLCYPRQSTTKSPEFCDLRERD
uniref:Ig-like domain-containing protein n=1 Tax=Sinocyclocheilus rhinocerous TaxID=307959 RepID=A0A673IRK1_9TELE